MTPATLEIVPLDGAYTLTVTTGYTINVGNYESRKLEATCGGTFSAVHSAKAVGEHLFDRAYDSIVADLNLTKHDAKANPKSIVHSLSTD